jgi:hypothetical protein
MATDRFAFRSAAGLFAGLIALWLSVLPITGAVQSTTAAISGVVTDQNGAVVQGAKITARNTETNLARTTASDEAGRFLIPELALGDYEVFAESDGFSKETHRGLVLTVGRVAVVNFNLKVGSVADEVVVTGDSPLVNTSSPEISALVPERTITDLPLNGRDIFQLATLQIGVVNLAKLTKEPIKAGPGAIKMSINGARSNFNNFLLDGSSINDFANTTPGSFAGGFTGVEAIQEFQILTNDYSPQYGGAGGAIISLVTKSGTNRVHGSAFEFIRNSALDARNFFDLGSAPPFKRNQFGGSIGGPIITGKTFFFGEYEGLRQRLADTTTFFVPTDAAKQGILPSGNVVVSPAMNPYLKLYPEPNAGDAGGGLGRFIRASTASTTEDHFTVRLDHLLTDRDTFFARYMFDQSNVITPDHLIQDTLNRGRNQYTGLGLTHIFSPRLLTSARFSYNRSQAFGDLIDLVKVDPSLLWVPGAPHLGDFEMHFGLTQLTDNVFYPRPIADNDFEVSDQIAYACGSHDMKFGFEGRRIQLNIVSNNAPDGAYIFSSYSSFLRGRASLFFAPLAGSDTYRGIRDSIFAYYAHDEWKVRRNLTVSFGLRYEYMTVPTEANGKISNMRDILHDSGPSVGSPFFLNPSHGDVAPRLGFAWDVFGDGKTSLRGGFGIFYAQLYPEAYRYAMSNQAPFFRSGIVLPSAAGPPPFPNGYQFLGKDILGVNQTETMQFKPSPTYVMEWNLSLQRQIALGFMVTAAYVGARGVHLVTDGNRNTSAAFTILPDGEKQFAPAPAVNPARNPLAGGPIRTYETDADSFYNALQINVERRLSNGLQVQMAYTYAHSIDTASDGVGLYAGNYTQFAQDPYNLRAERGPSVFDIRHNFSLSVIYELPYKTQAGEHGAARVANTLLGGWQANTIFSAHSGTHFSAVIGSFNNSNDGNGEDFAERPSYVPGFSGNPVTGDPAHYINTAAFVLAPAGRYGNVGRNTLVGPGYFSTDVSLFKTLFRIRESFKAQFRAEAFNVFNRANFALPDVTTVVTQGGVVPSSAGVITHTSTPSRQLQFALKLLF